MSKYEIVELDSGEYAVRTKQNWFEKLLGLETYHSWNIRGFKHSKLNYFVRLDSINKAKELIKCLEKRDTVYKPKKVLRVIND